MENGNGKGDEKLSILSIDDSHSQGFFSKLSSKVLIWLNDSGINAKMLSNENLT